MAACIHGEVCREYLRQHRSIICQTCPTGCRFYEPKRERTCRVIMKWDGFDGRDPVCSKCGTNFDDKKWHEQKFCPNCGAKVIQE